MITSQEIVDVATTSGLTPHVVEKDYVLGWLLWESARVKHSLKNGFLKAAHV